MRIRSTLLIASCVAVAACGLSQPAGVELPNLGSVIRERAIATPPGEVVDLRDVAPDHDWQKLVIIGPYPDGDEFERVAGFSWNASGAGSAVDESNVLAFVKDDEVIAYAELAGDVYFLSEEDTSLMVSRNEARFRVVLEDDGQSRRLDFARDE